MEVIEYTVKNSDELEGTLFLTIEHEGEQYELEFDFQKHGTSPSAHSPFPSPDKDIYAWPSEKIPDELLFEPGTEEARLLTLGIGLPDNIILLPDHYNNVDTSAKSPFVDYN